MEDQSQVSWSDLPHELWPLIGQRLDNYIDVLRFRSVCRSWRNSLPKLNLIFPLSHVYNREIYSIFYESILFRSIIYRFTPHDHHPSSNSVSKGFLAMIDNTNLSQRRVYLNYKSKKKGKKVNFLDYRIEEVARSYSLGATNVHTTDFQKLVKILVFPQKLKKHKNICMIVALHNNGWLLFMEYGENFKRQKFNAISKNANYDDVIVYNGQMYTIDRQGRMFLINSSMKLVQISDSMSVYGDLKHLVECGGEIYVVDRFVERKESQFDLFDSFWTSIRRWCTGECLAKSIDFKVHRLDQRRERWVEVKNLGNQAFVLGVDCFSISTPTDLQGFERNCIYFLNEVNSCLSYGYKYNTHVFNLEKSTILKSSVRILKAPPIWSDCEAFKLASDYYS